MANNLLELTEQIETYQVNRKNGAGEVISVIFNRRDGKVEEQTRALVSYATNAKEDTKKLINERVFYSVKLTRKPQKGDLVRYDNMLYKVEEVKKDNSYSSLYDIFVSSNEKPKGVKYGY